MIKNTIILFLLSTVSLYSEDKKNSDTFTIEVPKDWTEQKVNKSFTRLRVASPERNAFITISERDSLWRDDKKSITCKDSWDALETLTEKTFKGKFERNDLTGKTYPIIKTVKKNKIGTEKSIYVDYILVTPSIKIRLKINFILRNKKWYGVTQATFFSDQDMYLKEMNQAVKTFKFKQLNANKKLH